MSKKKRRKKLRSRNRRNKSSQVHKSSVLESSKSIKVSKRFLSPNGTNAAKRSLMYASPIKNTIYSTMEESSAAGGSSTFGRPKLSESTRKFIKKLGKLSNPIAFKRMRT
jgi:hypothetical protein